MFKSRSGKEPEIKTLVNCKIDLDRPVNIYIKSSSTQILVNYHYEKENEYKKCMEVTFPRYQFKNFFVSLFARSSAESNFRYDVSSMTYSSDVENTGVSEFEAKFDENIPKLFKQISFYKANQDILKSKNPKLESNRLDIPSINAVQSKVFDMIDYSNTQLSKSIEETSSILSYIENQNTSSRELGNTLLTALNRWLENTQKQYEIMDRDVRQMVNEFEAFNFEELLTTTQGLLDNLNKRLEETSDDFKKFRKFSKLIQKNLSTLNSKKAELYDFPNALKRLQADKLSSKSTRPQEILTILLGVLGFIIATALLSILYRLTMGRKRVILGY